MGKKNIKCPGIHHVHDPCPCIYFLFFLQSFLNHPPLTGLPNCTGPLEFLVHPLQIPSLNIHLHLLLWTFSSLACLHQNMSVFPEDSIASLSKTNFFLMLHEHQGRIDVLFAPHGHFLLHKSRSSEMHPIRWSSIPPFALLLSTNPLETLSFLNYFSIWIPVFFTIPLFTIHAKFNIGRDNPPNSLAFCNWASCFDRTWHLIYRGEWGTMWKGQCHLKYLIFIFLERWDHAMPCRAT